MARRRARTSHGAPTVTARVVLPPDIDLPRKIPWVQPVQRSAWDRRLTVAFGRQPRRGVVRSVTVVMPRNVQRSLIRPSVVMVSPRGVTVAPRRRARRILAVEPNRKRKEERKFRRARRYLFGQLDSLKSDRFGLVGRAFSTGSPIGSIAQAALVTRAIDGYLNRNRQRPYRPR